MQIVLSHRPFDRIASRGATLPFFSDERPLRRQAALVDWRLNGKISHLLEAKRMTGKMGDSLLMPTGGRLASEVFFLYGLGPQASWDPNRAERSFDRWIDKLVRLNFESWLLSLAALSDDFLGWRHCLRLFVQRLATLPGSAQRQLFLSENPKWVLEAKRRNMDFDVEVDLSFDLAAS